MNSVYSLRAKGLDVSINEWMTLIEALDKGLAGSSLTGFYNLCRSILIKTEADYDKFDAVFAEYFKGIETPEELPEEFWNWLNESDRERALDDLGDVQNFPKELEELLQMFQDRIKEQKEKHDGGNYWIRYRRHITSRQGRLQSCGYQGRWQQPSQISCAGGRRA